mmetsp:Transcript_24598/g.46631  ORF Transcript_24598/g.46631 Transcript_24598/m.46631 type:complete len:649 (-) Transcript_24598:1613-3559(-)
MPGLSNLKLQCLKVGKLVFIWQFLGGVLVLGLHLRNLLQRVVVRALHKLEVFLAFQFRLERRLHLHVLQRGPAEAVEPGVRLDVARAALEVAQPPGRVGGEQLGDDGAARGGEVAGDGVLAVHNRPKLVELVRLILEGRVPARHFVQQDAYAPPVHRRRVPGHGDDLRSHVRRRAARCVRLLALDNLFGKSEIRQLDVPARGDEEVLRLEVAMHVSQRVHELQRLDNASHVEARVILRDAPVGLLQDVPPQVPAHHRLYQHEDVVLVLVRRVQPDGPRAAALNHALPLLLQVRLQLHLQQRLFQHALERKLLVLEVHQRHLPVPAHSDDGNFLELVHPGRQPQLGLAARGPLHRARRLALLPKQRVQLLPQHRGDVAAGQGQQQRRAHRLHRLSAPASAHQRLFSEKLPGHHLRGLAVLSEEKHVPLLHNVHGLALRALGVDLRAVLKRARHQRLHQRLLVFGGEVCQQGHAAQRLDAPLLHEVGEVAQERSEGGVRQFQHQAPFAAAPHGGGARVLTQQGVLPKEGALLQRGQNNLRARRRLSYDLGLFLLPVPVPVFVLVLILPAFLLLVLLQRVVVCGKRVGHVSVPSVEAVAREINRLLVPQHLEVAVLHHVHRVPGHVLLEDVLALLHLARAQGVHERHELIV